MFERQNDKQFVEWAKKVKERDNFVCQLCGRYGVKLNSHHMNSWDTFIEQRYLLDNGITLCLFCHQTFHDFFSKGRNTVYQFAQFRRIVSLLRKHLVESDTVP